jgi:predicted acetyltransferase
MPELVLPAERYRESYLAAVAEFDAEGRSIMPNMAVSAPDFPAVLQRFADYRKGRNLPEGHVPSTAFWLVEGARFLGQLSIRHRLTPWLERMGGHIGYSIRPSVRGRGYGRLILRLALPEARRLGINPALVTCDATNIASRKIIEGNGGILANAEDPGNGQPPKLRYWVPTGEQG